MSRMMETIYLFVLTLESILWLPEALIIVRHLKITPEMRIIFENTDYPDDDPLFLRNWSTRQDICDRVINAREYIAMSQRDNTVPADSSSPSNKHTNLHDSNYQRILRRSGISVGPNYLTKLKVNIDARDAQHAVPFKIMKLLECIRVSRRNWFVAFNRNEKRMFLIERVQWRPKYKLKWTASLEPEAKYNAFSDGPQSQKRLFEYFLNQIKLGLRHNQSDSESGQTEPIYEVPERMTLCFVLANDHLRVCSVAFEALTQRSIRYFREERRQINHVNVGYSRCMSKRIELAPKQLVRVQVLPCAINRDVSSPQFFLLADSEVPGAVFVLQRSKKITRVKLTGRLDNLVVLLERPRPQADAALEERPKASRRRRAKKRMEDSTDVESSEDNISGTEASGETMERSENVTNSTEESESTNEASEESTDELEASEDRIIRSEDDEEESDDELEVSGGTKSTWIGRMQASKKRMKTLRGKKIVSGDRQEVPDETSDDSEAGSDYTVEASGKKKRTMGGRKTVLGAKMKALEGRVESSADGEGSERRLKTWGSKKRTLVGRMEALGNEKATLEGGTEASDPEDRRESSEVRKKASNDKEEPLEYREEALKGTIEALEHEGEVSEGRVDESEVGTKVLEVKVEPDNDRPEVLDSIGKVLGDEEAALDDREEAADKPMEEEKQH